MQSFRTKQLANDQLEAFDTDFIDESRRKKIKTYIDRDFPTGEFNFVDIGGGNGNFVDELLQCYPLACATVVDNSKLLIDKNSVNPRKTTILAPIEGLDTILGQKFDIVFLNFLLHHLIGDSYSETRKNQVLGLKVAKGLLASGGRISIFENIFDGTILTGVSSHLIFHLSSSKILAPFTRRLGANTAGVGVCFLSKQQWLNTINHAGLKVLQFTNDSKFTYSLYKRIFLHIGDARRGHFWCAPDF